MPKAGEDVGQEELAGALGGNEKWRSPLKDSLTISSKDKCSGTP